jgi:hypothetical protein
MCELLLVLILACMLIVQSPNAARLLNSECVVRLTYCKGSNISKGLSLYNKVM